MGWLCGGPTPVGSAEKATSRSTKRPSPGFGGSSRAQWTPPPQWCRRVGQGPSAVPSCGSQGASSSTDHGCSSQRRRLGTKKGVRPERQSVPCGVFCVLTAVCDSKAVSLWLCKVLTGFRGPFMRRAFSSAGVRNSGPHGSVE
jgi:hypothetical protein